jgi:hypothetical protein
VFNGTPLKAACWRLLGAKVGKRLLDDGAGFPERCYVRVGDFVTMNLGSIVQNHSQEDGAFKSDLIHIGSGATLGTGCFVHYGTTVGDNAVISAAAFVMKGEQVPDDDYWGGNPAQPMDRPRVPAPLEVPQSTQAALAEPTRRLSTPRRDWALVAYGAALAAAGTPLARDGGPLGWRALGAAAWAVGLGCLGVSARRRWSPRAATTEAAVLTSVQAVAALEPGPAPTDAPGAPTFQAATLPGSTVPQQFTPAPDVPEFRPMIPAPASASPTWSDSWQAADPSALPALETSPTWARLSAELDRLEELRSRWAS